jgi:hypothetical protein
MAEVLRFVDMAGILFLGTEFTFVSVLFSEEQL